MYPSAILSRQRSCLSCDNGLITIAWWTHQGPFAPLFKDEWCPNSAAILSILPCRWPACRGLRQWPRHSRPLPSPGTGNADDQKINLPSYVHADAITWASVNAALVLRCRNLIVNRAATAPIVRKTHGAARLVPNGWPGPRLQAEENKGIKAAISPFVLNITRTRRWECV